MDEEVRNKTAVQRIENILAERRLRRLNTEDLDGSLAYITASIVQARRKQFDIGLASPWWHQIY